jgi:hypothetical protein
MGFRVDLIGCGIRVAYSQPSDRNLLEDQMAAHMAEKKGTFLEEVIGATLGGERLVHCFQCGSCCGRLAANTIEARDTGVGVSDSQNCFGGNT